MTNLNEKLLLVGDNPFHNISHLSQERARLRVEDPVDTKYAASLVSSSMENGANGFMFSVSETTLAILKELAEREIVNRLRLYGIVPYAFDYVRLATQLGGIPGLAKRFGKDLLSFNNVRTMGFGLKGILTSDIATLMKAYLSYEIARVKSCVGKSACIDSVLLHQLLTDMALALDMDWLFESYINFLEGKHILPGFNTGNFAFLVHKFNEWGLDLGRVVLAAPFNKVGFQMIPSTEECEAALLAMPKPNVIAISVLAAGYVSPNEAVEYIAGLQNVKGVAVGVSKEKHATETFRLLSEHFK
ncbi:hypothetical protein E2P61_02635 [Candidatus Bathyarchaeota archaeon]|nr:hypothetical protein E2P61_02635 [Candidatus Bathyarchaeota archaeon]